MNEELLLALWGKTDRTNSANYHPLLYHLIDVAQSAGELWDRLPTALRRRLTASIGLADEYAAGRRFAAVAGLHDIGKACPNFERKAPQLMQILASRGFDFPDYDKSHPHAFVSTWALLGGGEPHSSVGLNHNHLHATAYALGAHHGEFPRASEVQSCVMTSNVVGMGSIWGAARDQLEQEVRRAVLGRDWEVRLAPPVSTEPCFAPLLAALVSVADWLGSSRYFPIRGPVWSVATYPTHAAECARAALDGIGWAPSRPAPAPAEFQALFRYLDRHRRIEPNPLQRSVEVALRSVDGPAMWILEEQMGAGKTEAAFRIFDAMRVGGSAHGIYIAMPTQATSNAMHVRLRSFLAEGRGEEDLNLVLAHSHAILNAEYRARVDAADSIDAPIYDDGSDAELAGKVGTDEETAGTLRIRGWFTALKQALLAPYGVGTIDQALLGALHARHWFVRLLGLAGKVVVFDEVHAYDAYTNELLVVLIEWLAQLDCTVVVLSATLPARARDALANAYRIESSTELRAQETRSDYPRVSVIPRDPSLAVRCEPVTMSDEERRARTKSVQLSHLADSSLATRIALLEAVPGDGCALIVCNTVDRAQSLFAELTDPDNENALTRHGWDCRLFHARTPFRWRKETEDWVLDRFGKRSGDDGALPRSRTLVVATQVVEQSLDLDADFMASELAPIDLLLQRMGRLWRHVRARSAVEARFALLCDLDPDGFPLVTAWRDIYAEQVLLRTWLEIQRRMSSSGCSGTLALRLPGDIAPMVEAVYDGADPGDLAATWKQRLADAAEDRRRTTERSLANARARVVRPQEPGDDFLDWIEKLSPTVIDDDDPEINEAIRALTREGRPSITVVCCGTDDRGEPLAPERAGRIDTEQTAKMLEFSLSISNPRVYHALKTPTDETVPSNWRRLSQLKHCRRLQFNSGHCTVVPGATLTLSRETGLRIVRER